MKSNSTFFKAIIKSSCNFYCVHLHHNIMKQYIHLPLQWIWVNALLQNWLWYLEFGKHILKPSEFGNWQELNIWNTKKVAKLHFQSLLYQLLIDPVLCWICCTLIADNKKEIFAWLRYRFTERTPEILDSSLFFSLIYSSQFGVATWSI